MISLTMPDGSARKVAKGTTALEVARSISEGLARNVLAAEINGEIIDATRPMESDAVFKLLTFKEEGGKYAMWHSSAHLMAEAFQFYYPKAKFAIGPPIENGFYYDIDFGEDTFSEHDLSKIENKMLELAREKNDFIRQEISKKEAIDYFTTVGDEYKLELLEELEDGTITFYKQGNFTDLCRGPHIPNTGFIKAVKLLKVAGAYWRGDENNKQLTRIYGITFPKQKELKEHLLMLEEAKKRDHRKLGKELGLFHFSRKVGQGLPLWLPKGTAIRTRLEDFLKAAQKKSGYLPVITPHIANKDLYVTSGHWDKYGEDSFQPIKTPNEGELYLLKPMNCPHHCEIYKAEPRSYRDLPIRYAEFGTVYRYEQSGELHGLTRVRGFTQDDAHIFCTPEQVKEEIAKVIDLVLYIFKTLSFEEFVVQVSLRDMDKQEKYIGSEENWEKAEKAIQEVVESKDINYVIEHGEAAFYGPKLDFMVRDAIGRKWQLGTVQLDYNLPERFELEYQGANNDKQRPVMIHRAPFGSMERFMAILIEHTAGKFPLWLTPEQIRLLPLSEKFNEFTKELSNVLNNHDIRAQIDNRNEKVGKKIRDAEVEKVPYMLIIGAEEVESGKLSLRKQGEGEIGKYTIDELKTYFNQEIESLLA